MNPIIHRINDWADCPTCKGTGKVMQATTYSTGGLVVPKGIVPCPRCSGKGMLRVTKLPIGVQGCRN